MTDDEITVAVVVDDDRMDDITASFSVTPSDMGEADINEIECRANTIRRNLESLSFYVAKEWADDRMSL